MVILVPMPVVSVVMGSRSDWDVMRHTCETLDTLAVEHEAKVMSAHRTPERVKLYTEAARGRGIKVIIAGAGGAAHLAGVMASLTTLPVFGVPMESKSLKGLDSLLSIVQMPGGIPVGTLGIGKPGAINAALLAAAVLALTSPNIADALDRWRAEQTAAVPELPFDTL